MQKLSFFNDFDGRSVNLHWLSKGETIKEHQTNDVIEKLRRAATPQDVFDGLTSFTGHYGLTSMIAGTIPSPKERKAAQEQRLLVSAFPAEWIDRYFEQGYVRIDPIVRRMKRDSSPFLWSESLPFADAKHSVAVKRMIDEASEFKLNNGIAVPMITLDGVMAFVSLGGEAIELPPAGLGMISMISTFAVARAIDLRHQEKERPAPRLTPREIECLKWVADGKTDWEISVILKVSEHTADKHLANALRKLGARSRAQAVAQAIRWRLIS